jgi:HAE1 family hydrophobic/amphiphilic exporter-1
LISWITKISIKYKWITLSIAALLAIGSVLATAELNQELVPDIEFPMTTVITLDPGAPTKEMVESVSIPLERSIDEADIDGLKHIESTTSKGNSLVFITFEYGTDMDEANSKIREAVSQANLPDSVRNLPAIYPQISENPKVFPINMNVMPVVSITLNGNLPVDRLEEIALEQVLPAIQPIDGVFNVSISGGYADKVIITPNLEEMGNHQISVMQLAGVLSTNRFNSIEEVENFYLSPTGLKLSEVTDVSFGPEPGTIINRTNSNPSISIDITKETEANTVSTANAVVEKLVEIEDSLPGNLSFVTILDQSEYIEDSISDLTNNAIIGFILAIIVVFVFLLAFRPSIVTAVSIPLSLLFGFLVMYFSGLTINILTLSAMVIVIGRVIDNSIVVLEVIHRRMKEGERFKDAAINGVREIGMPITASTIATVVIFIPLMFVGGIAGEMFLPFGLTIVFALIASLIIAVTIIPALYSALLPRDEKRARPPREINNTWYHRIYTASLKWALGHKLAVVAIAVVLFLGSFSLIPLIGTSYFASMGSNVLIATIEMPRGTDMMTTYDVVLEAEEILAAQPEVIDYNSMIGVSGSAMEASFALSGSSNLAQINFTVDRESDMTAVSDKISSLLGGITETGTITIETEDSAMAAMSQSIEVTVSGNEIAQIVSVADEIATELASNAGITDVAVQYADTSSEILIEPDPVRMAALGLSPEAIEALQMELMLLEHGGPIASVNIEGDEREIYLSPVFAEIGTVEAASSLYVGAPFTFQLGQIANIELGSQASTLHRLDQNTSATVLVETSSQDLGGITMEIQAAIDEMSIPESIEIGIGGVIEDMMETFSAMFIAIGLAILLVFGVLLTTFRSVKKPIIIMVSLPLASIGALIALLITGKTLGVAGMMGVLMLVGIVLTNAVVLIDVVDQFRKKGLSVFDALVSGGHTRLNPILMTALTTMIAMVPLALFGTEGGLIASELAVVVIGGLFSSTILTLLVLPVLYAIMHKEKKVAKLT